MGKGDKRTRRGKIFAGSYGKTRTKPHKTTFVATAKPETAASEKPVKKRAPKRVPAAKAAAALEASAEATVAPETAAETPETSVGEAPAQETAAEGTE